MLTYSTGVEKYKVSILCCFGKFKTAKMKHSFYLFAIGIKWDIQSNEVVVKTCVVIINITPCLERYNFLFLLLP